MIISVSSIAQTKVECNVIKTSHWNKTLEKWEFEDQDKYADLTFTIYDRDVYVNDIAHSHYKIYGDGRKNSTEHSSYTAWSAIDEKGRNCSFILTKAYDDFYISIMYGDICFDYKQYSGLSNFKRND